MSQAIETHTPNPNRRGFLFYGSAVLAAFGLSKVVLPGGPDPVFAAIDAFHAAASAVLNASDTSDLAMEPLFLERERTLFAMAQTKPTTKEGAHAVMAEVINDDSYMVDFSHSPIPHAIDALLAAWPA